MFLASATEVLAGVTRILGLTAVPASYEALSRTAGAGMIALQLDPAAWTMVRAIRDGWGDPERNFRLLQGRLEGAASGFQRLFPHGGSFNLQDLARAHLERGSRSIFPIRDRVAVTGDESILPEELLIPIGGLFVFDRGTAGFVRWDTRLVDRGSPFPLSLPTDIGPFESGETFGIGQERAPRTWDHAKGFTTRVDEGWTAERVGNRTTLRRGGQVRRIVVAERPMPHLRANAYATEGAHEIAVGTITYFRYPGLVQNPSRAQRGISVSTSGDVPFIHTWEVEEPSVVDATHLDADLRQMFFTPGALLLVRTGRPAEIPQIPIRPLAAMVRGASRVLEGDASSFQPGIRLRIDTSPEGGDLLVRIEDTGEPQVPAEEILFGGEHPSWLARSWVYRQGGFEVEALRVAGNHPAEHSRAEGLIRENLALANGVRTALDRSRSPSPTRPH